MEEWLLTRDAPQEALKKAGVTSYFFASTGDEILKYALNK
jgi:hypothetical protein